MSPDQQHPRGLEETRQRILDVAVEVLGRDPRAGVGEVAAAAGVVRRTVYGYFPSRSDLLVALAQRAGQEVRALMSSGPTDGPDALSADVTADVAWAGFTARLWPLADRYRVLVALRRSEEHRAEIHAALAEVEAPLTALVARGQAEGVFGEHLPAEVLGQLAWSTVFTLVDGLTARGEVDAATATRAVTVTSLLVLGVPLPRAHLLAGRT